MSTIPAGWAEGPIRALHGPGGCMVFWAIDAWFAQRGNLSARTVEFDSREAAMLHALGVNVERYGQGWSVSFDDGSEPIGGVLRPDELRAFVDTITARRLAGGAEPVRGAR